MNNWVEENSYLVKTFNLKGYNEVISFALKIVRESNSQNHHPELVLNYNNCKVRLITNDLKKPKITEKDFKLSKSIDKIFKETYE